MTTRDSNHRHFALCRGVELHLANGVGMPIGICTRTFARVKSSGPAINVSAFPLTCIQLASKKPC